MGLCMACGTQPPLMGVQDLRDLQVPVGPMLGQDVSSCPWTRTSSIHCLHFLFEDVLGAVAHPWAASPAQRGTARPLAPARATGTSGLCRQGCYMFVAECGWSQCLDMDTAHTSRCVSSRSIRACPPRGESGGTTLMGPSLSPIS